MQQLLFYTIMSNVETYFFSRSTSPVNMVILSQFVDIFAVQDVLEILSVLVLLHDLICLQDFISA